MYDRHVTVKLFKLQLFTFLRNAQLLKSGIFTFQNNMLNIGTEIDLGPFCYNIIQQFSTSFQQRG